MNDKLGSGIDSKGRVWEVYEEVAGKWRWRRCDKKGKLETESEAVFDTMEECKNHARTHGMDGDYITLAKDSEEPLTIYE